MLHQLTKLHYWTCLCIRCFSLHRSQFSATLLLINILMFRVYFLLSLSCLERSLCHLPGITIDSYLFLQSVLNIQAESLSCIIMAFFFLSTIYQCTVTSSYDHKASLLFQQDIFYFQNQPVKGIQSSLNPELSFWDCCFWSVASWKHSNTASPAFSRQGDFLSCDNCPLQPAI